MIFPEEYVEAFALEVFKTKTVLNICQNSQRDSCARILFNKVIKKTVVKVRSCEYDKFFGAGILYIEYG